MGTRGTNLLEVNKFLLLNACLDPVKNIFEAFHVDTGDGESLAVVVHELMTDAVAEDHGDIAGEFAINALQSRISGLLVENGYVGTRVFKATRSNTGQPRDLGRGIKISVLTLSTLLGEFLDRDPHGVREQDLP